jgi:hypothetical protein
MKIAKMMGGMGLVMAWVLVAGCAGASTRLERRFYTVMAVVTNLEEAYTFQPNTNAGAEVSTASRVAGLFGPWGEIVGVLLGPIASCGLRIDSTDWSIPITNADQGKSERRGPSARALA